jgi:HEAT repeat protein
VRNVQGAQSIGPISGVLHGDPDARVRRTAARTLGALGTPAAIEALRTSSGDPDALVRREVDRALRRAGASPPR